ncbi:MAG: hypothetical protein ACYCPQ_01530 [Elusimicrobiota bacterium]
MTQKQPFFQRRAKSRPRSLFKRKKESAAAVAVLAAAFLILKKMAPVTNRSAASSSNPGLAIGPDARAIPLLPSRARSSGQESLSLINGSVIRIINPAVADRENPSAELPMTLPRGLESVSASLVGEALSGAAAFPNPKPMSRKRARGFRRAARLKAIVPCSGRACVLRGLARARVLTSGDDPCLALKGCTAEDAAADGNAAYDGAAAPPASGPSPLDQSAPEISQNARPLLNGQNNQEAQAQAQSLETALRRCVAADVLYLGSRGRPGPQIAAQDDFTRSYRKFSMMGCLSGGDPLCSRMREQAQASCRRFDAVRRAHYKACPLDQSAGPYEPAGCLL